MKLNYLFFICFSIFLIGNVFAFYDGNGDDSNPYQINTIEDLNEVRDYLDSSFVLLKDLNFDDCDSYSNCVNNIYFTSGIGWTPIGDASNFFTGVFDGNNFIISNLYMRPKIRVNGVGLIGSIYGGVIKNVSSNNVDIIPVSGTSYVGGLVGQVVNSDIINCHSLNGTITGAGSFTGGLVGLGSNMTLSNSSADNYVRGANYVGGLVGQINSASNVFESYSNSYVFCAGNYVGGFIGANVNSFISDSYSTGGVYATTITRNRGGFVAVCNNCSIKNSYSTGNVRFEDAGSNGGGFVGSNTLGALSEDSGNYWDVDSSGWETSVLGTGKTTLEMQDKDTFIGGYCSNSDYSNEYDCMMNMEYWYRVEWDFDDIWALDSNYNNGYPNLDGINPVEKFNITFNVKDLDSNTDLNFVNVDCNVNDYDVSDKNSPFSIEFGAGGYSCNFSKIGYDSNNNFEVVADANNNYTIYLEESSVSDVCDRTLNEDWFISTFIDCNSKSINLGTGKLILNSGGRLRLYDSNLITNLFDINASGSELWLGSGSWIKIG